MKYVIFAPHIDDEVIGCHSLLQQEEVASVWYFFEFDENRMNEAVAAANWFGFAPMFPSRIEDFETACKKFGKTIFAHGTKILVPRIDDHHWAHKAVNRMAKRIFPKNLLFYSIDMNCNPERYNDERKKEDLYRLYPSQKQYFDDHPQCYQFEHISKVDGVDTGD